MLQVKRIPEKTGYYLAGFADAQGYFRVAFNKKATDDNSVPRLISLHFEIVHQDKVMLSLFKRHLKCGTLYDGGNVWHYEVSNLNALRENVIPFFKRFNFLSAEKKGKFSKFKQIMSLLLQDDLLTPAVLREILELSGQLDQQTEGNITESEILQTLVLGESSETTRQAPFNLMDE